MSKELIKEAFSLPHVQSIWVTPDNHFYLHSVQGAKRIDRGADIDADAKTAEPEIEVKKPTKKK